MRVGILGGSFNPPHQGHIHISELALKKLQLAQIWWIPTPQNPLKKSHTENYENRLQSCQKILGKNFKIRLLATKEIYTFRLLQNLRKKYPSIEFFWIMGADNLENFHRWGNFKKIPQLAQLAVFSREDSLKKATKTRAWNFLKNKSPRIFFTKNLDISSTKLRNER